MRPYNPYLTPSELSDPREYLSREFHNVKQTVDQVHDLDVISSPIQTPREGMIRYVDGVNWDPYGIYKERGVGKGPYYYDGTAWIPMFQIPAPTWYDQTTTPLILNTGWQTYLSVSFRPIINSVCIVSGSCLCGATITLKNLMVTLRLLINGVEFTNAPRWGFAHAYGSNTSLDMYQSVDYPLTFDPSIYASPDPASPFFCNVTIEVQGRTNNIGDIDKGYIYINEVL